MILATLSVAAPTGRRRELMEAFSSLLGPVRVEPGCMRSELYQQSDNRDEFLYVEEWDTPENLERHMRSERYGRLLELMESSVRPPVLRYCVVSGARGMEYLEAIRLGGEWPT